MFSTKSIVSRFADYFDKSIDSNLSKFISIFSDEMVEAQDSNDLVRSWRSIDSASGSTLDLIGSEVRQLRGTATDERYRIMLKAKIARNLSDGTMDSIINILSLVLSVPASNFEIIEKWNDLKSQEYAAIRLVGVPTEALEQAGLSADDFLEIVQSIVAAGVKVIDVELDHNTHRELSVFTHRQLSQLTHNKIRTEVPSTDDKNDTKL